MCWRTTLFGADGPDPAGGLVGVAKGSSTSNPVSGGVGGAIAGQFGTLTLQTDGSYSYKANTGVANGAVDNFVYTIKDGDGDLSTTTLKITVANMTVSDNDALVNEAGLAGGSAAATNSEIFNGAITASGGAGSYTFALTTPATGSRGNLALNPDGTYTYTLTSRYDTSPDANNGALTEQDRDSFGYKVTDANGNTSTGTILADIVDDVPLAKADTGSVGQAATTTGSVLTNDIFGADGPTMAGGGVTGVAKGSTTSTPVSGGLGGSGIAGDYGTLTLNADGSYAYKAKAGVAGGCDRQLRLHDQGRRRRHLDDDAQDDGDRRPRYVQRQGLRRQGRRRHQRPSRLQGRHRRRSPGGRRYRQCSGRNLHVRAPAAPTSVTERSNCSAASR